MGEIQSAKRGSSVEGIEENLGHVWSEIFHFIQDVAIINELFSAFETHDCFPVFAQRAYFAIHEGAMMRLARLTDPAEQMVRGSTKRNYGLRALVESESDHPAHWEKFGLVGLAEELRHRIDSASWIRRWRDTKGAHSSAEPERIPNQARLHDQKKVLEGLRKLAVKFDEAFLSMHIGREVVDRTSLRTMRRETERFLESGFRAVKTSRNELH